SSVVNVSQIATVDRNSLIDRVGILPDDHMDLVARGLRMVLEL
ncbi:MAG: type II toxin-antitoxin system PemK/MazF family toxin, partial [Acidimicrobiia bacterium]|nr:type II toxin-antitoxin system PemK/MazF family toxin [Acidimicrobiia bacterium]